MGVFPILEILGQASPNDITFPASYAIETELANAFRAALPPSTVQAAEFETEANGTLRFRWPAPGKDLTNKKRPSTNTGNGLTS